ncbi:DVU_1553 family AMP-dependent CoA ligase [Acetobacterium sp.]|uniref:DVU_1553 family AMP-dependent CoA ligase n=1 Tax=Acetobacterium sp. TaxID=1872094 RepID=UPI002F41E463
MNAIEKTPLEEWIGVNIGQNPGRLSRTNLDEYQLEALQKTIGHAKNNSAFYRSLLKDIHSGDISSLSDISKLPFINSTDIRNQGSQMICVKQREIHRIVTLDTSGTTGTPKRIYFSKEDQELTIDFFHYGMSTFTAPGDKVLVLLPGKVPGSIGDLLKIGLARMGVEAFIYGIVDDKDAVMDIILNQKINGIVGIPQQIFALAKAHGSEFVKAAATLKFVLLSTDYVSPSISEAIKNSWGCQVYEHYGMTEMGLGGGVFCKALKGYHLREADLFFEIVNPETGRNVPDGEFGEVVFTTLTRTGMPLIRYKTGDISRFLTSPCACGTLLKTMDSVSHRMTASVILENGQNLTMPILEDLLFSVDGVLDFDAEITFSEVEDKVISQNREECLIISITKIAEFEKVQENVRLKIQQSFLKDLVLAGRLKININQQKNKELDIKAIRKRNLLDSRDRNRHL